MKYHLAELGDVPPILQREFAPVEQELSLSDLQVEGQLPSDFQGSLIRNGPNPMFAPLGRYHWFDGDGMLHAVNFKDGKASYRNRWVRTASLSEEQVAQRALWRGVKETPRRDRPDMPLKDTSNTDVKAFAGKLISMWYLGGSVYELDPQTLETLGPLKSEGPQGQANALADLPISAHSKPCPRTGELLFFAYGKQAPYMWFGVLSPEHKLSKLIPVATPGPRLPHDMAITQNFAILHDLPLFYDEHALQAGRHKLKFHENLPSRFAVVPRDPQKGETSIRWFDAKPCYMYHTANAWEQSDGQGGTEIVMIGTPFKLPERADGSIDGAAVPRLFAELDSGYQLYEWRFNLRTGLTHERVLDDVLNQEFPVIQGEFLGQQNRYSWGVLMGKNREPEHPRFSGLVMNDLQRGTTQSYHEGMQRWYSEPQFAPRQGGQNEAEGYLLSFVWNGDAQRSEVQVFDALTLCAGPLARVVLPQRVPAGFHGTWLNQ